MRMMARTGWRLVGVAALVLGCLAAPTMATATSTGERFTGCLKTGALSEVAVGAHPLHACSKGARRITWSLRGPAGPRGSSGVTGWSFVTSAEVPSGTCTAGDSDVDLGTDEVYSCSGAVGRTRSPASRERRGSRDRRVPRAPREWRELPSTPGASTSPQPRVVLDTSLEPQVCPRDRPSPASAAPCRLARATMALRPRWCLRRRPISAGSWDGRHPEGRRVTQRH